MKKATRTWKVSCMQREFLRIEFPLFQREPTVWSRDAKQRLIDSIVREFDIAALYFYLDEEGTKHCVDGRQRINAIMSFLGKNPKDRHHDGFEFSVKNEIYEDTGHPFAALDGLTFAKIQSRATTSDDETAKKFVRAIDGYELTSIELSGEIEPQEFNLQFARLNLGTIINSGEKLNAMVGAMRDVCFERLGKHEFLRRASVPTRRYSREQLAAQIVTQVFAMERDKRFARTRHFDLQGLFKAKTTLGETELAWVQRIEDVLNELARFQALTTVLRSRAMVVSAVWLAYRTRVTGDVSIETVAGFLEEFVVRLKWQMRKGLEIDRPYRYLVDFQRNLTQASVERAAVEGRSEMLEEGLARWCSKQEIRGDAKYAETHRGEKAAEVARKELGLPVKVAGFCD